MAILRMTPYIHNRDMTWQSEAPIAAGRLTKPSFPLPHLACPDARARARILADNPAHLYFAER
jgi:hypothetical protein